MEQTLALVTITDTSPVNGGAFDGFFHMLTQLDHVLVLLAVGALLARLEGRWLARSAVALALAAGAGVALAALRILLPLEPLRIALLVLSLAVAIGLPLSLAQRAPVFAAGLSAALAFVLAHSHAAEVANTAAKYALGFGVGAAILVLAAPLFGLALAWITEQRRPGALAGRMFGAAAAVATLAGATGLLR